MKPKIQKGVDYGLLKCYFIFKSIIESESNSFCKKFLILVNQDKKGISLNDKLLCIWAKRIRRDRNLKRFASKGLLSKGEHCFKK